MNVCVWKRKKKTKDERREGGKIEWSWSKTWVNLLVVELGQFDHSISFLRTRNPREYRFFQLETPFLETQRIKLAPYHGKYDPSFLTSLKKTYENVFPSSNIIKNCLTKKQFIVNLFQKKVSLYNFFFSLLRNISTRNKQRIFELMKIKLNKTK